MSASLISFVVAAVATLVLALIRSAPQLAGRIRRARR
jgi:hypothetical protein